MWLYHRVMSPNGADGMANSVDPDQTAPRSSLIWVCTVCPGISVRKLRIITVFDDFSVLAFSLLCRLDFFVCSFPLWCLGKEVEFDCIGSWSLPFESISSSCCWWQKVKVIHMRLLSFFYVIKCCKGLVTETKWRSFFLSLTIVKDLGLRRNDDVHVNIICKTWRFFLHTRANFSHILVCKWANICKDTYVCKVSACERVLT